MAPRRALRECVSVHVPGGGGVGGRVVCVRQCVGGGGEIACVYDIVCVWGGGEYAEKGADGS